MTILKPLSLVMVGAILAGGCAPSEVDDADTLIEDENTANVEQRLGNGYTRPNNQVLQGCVGYVNTSGYLEKLQGLKRDSTNSSGVQSWSLQWVNGFNWTQSTPVQLTFAPSGTALPGKAVKSLGMSTANKGWFVVTWFNGSTATSTTTTTMNSANLSGDRLLITMPPINGRGATYYQISSHSNSATSGQYGFYQCGDLNFNLQTMTANNWICQDKELTFVGDPENGYSWATPAFESYLIPFAGHRWDPVTATRVNDPTFISFGSPPDALGGCEDWGYGPWGTQSDKFDACTRAKRGDICGDGRAWTYLHGSWFGISVQIWDDADYHPMAPQEDSNMEAWYTSTGASCLNPAWWRAPDMGAGSWPYDSNSQPFDPANSCGHPVYSCVGASPGKIGIGRDCDFGGCL